MDTPIILPPIQDIVMSCTGQNHPLAVQGHLPLAAWPVSGDSTNLEVYQNKLLTCYGSRGGHQQSCHIPLLGDNEQLVY